MQGANALLGLIPLYVAGFLFCNIWYRTRFQLAFADGQRMFFMCAAAGLVSGLLAWPASNALHELDWVQGLGRLFGPFPTEHVMPLSLSVTFACTAATVFNLVSFLVRKWEGSTLSTRDWAFHRFVEAHGNLLQQLALRALLEEKKVLVTLKSRKLYCGRVSSFPPQIGGKNDYLELIPAFSAFREKDTLALSGRLDYPAFDFWQVQNELAALKAIREMEDDVPVATTESLDGIDVNKRIAELQGVLLDAAGKMPTDYFESMRIRDWCKIIPFDQIESLSLWDETAYGSWFAPKPTEQAVILDSWSIQGSFRGWPVSGGAVQVTQDRGAK